MHRLALALLVIAACTDDASPTVAFDLAGPHAGDTFWDLPFPSDLRLTADGRPDLAGFPNKRNLPVVTDLLSAASERHGFPVMPIAYFHFVGDVVDHALGPTPDAQIIDIDDSSPERGTTYPVVAESLPDDSYVKGVVAFAPSPGIVLRGATRYAVVVKRSFAPAFSPPSAMFDKAIASLYDPLWKLVDRNDVLVATVFTTGDEIALLRARSEAIRAAHDATIANLQKDPRTFDGFCSFTAEVTFPQFQKGIAPYSTEGRFELDAQGTPIAQGSATVPLRITIPTGPMPAGGWPLWQYFHGSGGASFDLVDEGPSATPDGTPQPGEGPGAVVARRGIAAASSSLPIDNERLPSAGSYDYININNLSAFPYTFQQGVYEQRLLLDALVALQVPTCDGAPGHFDSTKLLAGGHSMGGMYTNMVAAIEPRYGAVTPFGAGGFWNMMILDTAIVPGARGLLGSVLGVDGDTLTFAHPAMGLIELGWEIADPINSMARIAHRPLPGLSARHVYQPIGLDDKYFPMPVFDAAAAAYGNQQAGEMVWPTTQDALATEGLDGLLPYPVRANAKQGTTAVVVQYRDGGIVDAHQIYRQLDEVKYQYGCFLASYLRDGVPTVPAPAPLSASCP